MAISDCIDAGILEGSISRKTGDEAKRKFSEFAEDFGNRGRLSKHERELRAAQRLEADLERARKRRKRMRLIQATKQVETVSRINEAPAGTAEKAALSVLEFDPFGKFRGDNVASAYQALRGTAWSIAADFIDKFRSRHAGLSRDLTGLADVIKGLFGEKTTAEGRAFAQSIQEARNYLVRRHNAAGGDIRLRADWGWVQRHDAELIREAGKEAWRDYILPRLDLSRMFDVAGEPLTERGLIRLIDAAFDDITGISPLTDVAGEFSSPISKRVYHREFVFKDAASWIEYQQRYGDGDILSSIIGEMDKLARETALIETLGPYPHATLKAMETAVDLDRARARSKSLRKKVGRHDFLEAVFDQVSGKVGIASNSTIAGFFQGTRNMITSARLGSAVFVAASDFGTASLASRMNGLPFTKVMGEYLGQLSPSNPAHRRLAARLGYITETWLGDLVAAQRMLGEISGAAVTARIADTSLRLSGLSIHTEGLRNAFKVSYVGHLAEQAGRRWADVDATTREAMARYGITEADWQLYRSTPLWTDAETGADFIRIEDVHRAFDDVKLAPEERAARKAAAAKFHSLVSTEAKFAVIEPTARSRSFINQKAKAGSFPGEVVRSIAQFKSFLIAFTYMHGARGMAQKGISNKLMYAAGLVIPMTLAGAFAEQMSAISRGQDVRDMNDPKFWLSAIARGGSFGPLGDFLFSDKSRHGHGFIASLAGPLAGTIEQGVKLTVGNVQKLFAGEDTSVARDLVRFFEGFLPGNSLWYTRLAIERFLKDQLLLLTDPDIKSKWRRAETKARREFGQRYWWRRGRARPDRSPVLSQAPG